MTTELVLAELLCCDCVFCNFLVFYVSRFYFILWAAVSAAYSALLSSSYFERINDDDDDDDDDGGLDANWRHRMVIISTTLQHDEQLENNNKYSLRVSSRRRPRIVRSLFQRGRRWRSAAEHTEL